DLVRLDAPTVFLASAAGTLAATIYVIVLLPDALLRLLLWFATHSLYRIRVEGRDNIPEKGGALFVSNHLSLIDALLLTASTDRRISFLMFKDYYVHHLIIPIATVTHALQIHAQQSPR